MKFQRLIQKAFIGGKWFVLYKERGEDQYHRVPVKNGTWIADPFLYEANGEHFIFVELYESVKGRAGIGYYRFENGIPVFKGMVISKPYHLSYPCIFQHDGIHYMIPESSSNSTIELYRAEKFPENWALEKVLLQGYKLVDSTVEIEDGVYYLYCYGKFPDGWKLYRYALDMEKKQLGMRTEVVYSENTGRPAGHFWGGELEYRPAQDCRKKYGESILVYRVDSRECFTEKLSSVITVDEIVAAHHFDRIHTINSDSKYEVVDAFHEQIDLLHGVKIFIRSYLR